MTPKIITESYKEGSASIIISSIYNSILFLNYDADLTFFQTSLYLVYQVGS
jgi:hypothetical protein